MAPRKNKYKHIPATPGMREDYTEYMDYNEDRVGNLTETEFLHHILYFLKSKQQDSIRQADFYSEALIRKIDNKNKKLENLEAQLSNRKENLGSEASLQNELIQQRAKIIQLETELEDAQKNKKMSQKSQKKEMETQTELTQMVLARFMESCGRNSKVDDSIDEESENKVLQITKQENIRLNKEILQKDMHIERLQQENILLQKEIDLLNRNLEKALRIDKTMKDLEGFIHTSIVNLKAASSSPQPFPPTYAEKLSRPSGNSIIVKHSKADITADEIGEELHKVGLEGIQVNDCRKTPNGNLIVRCNTEQDVSKFKERITNSSIKDSVQLIEQTGRIIIFSIPNSVTNDNLESIIRTKYSYTKSICFVKSQEAKDSYHQTLQLDLQTAKKLVNDRKILIHMRSCPVRRYLTLKRCFRCQRTGHTHLSCDKQKFSVACEFCSLTHESRDCPNKENEEAHQCVNCLRENRRNKQANLNTNHKSSSNVCQTFIRNLREYRTTKNSI